MGARGLSLSFSLSLSFFFFFFRTWFLFYFAYDRLLNGFECFPPSPKKKAKKQEDERRAGKDWKDKGKKGNETEGKH